jgi:hypothetical protein
MNAPTLQGDPVGPAHDLETLPLVETANHRDGMPADEATVFANDDEAVRINRSSASGGQDLDCGESESTAAAKGAATRALIFGEALLKNRPKEGRIKEVRIDMVAGHVEIL